MKVKGDARPLQLLHPQHLTKDQATVLLARVKRVLSLALLGYIAKQTTDAVDRAVRCQDREIAGDETRRRQGHLDPEPGQATCQDADEVFDHVGRHLRQHLDELATLAIRLGRAEHRFGPRVDPNDTQIAVEQDDREGHPVQHQFDQSLLLRRALDDREGKPLTVHRQLLRASLDRDRRPRLRRELHKPTGLAREALTRLYPVKAAGIFIVFYEQTLNT